MLPAHACSWCTTTRTSAVGIDTPRCAVVAFVWSFGEWGAVWFARKYPAAYKRLSDLAERYWIAEMHHKNVTLSRR